MCGENLNLRPDSSIILGSPPPVRGKLDESDPIAKLARITPACAGKTVPERVCQQLVRDHPRMCGENPLVHSGTD